MPEFFLPGKPTHLCKQVETVKMFKKLQEKWGISGWRFFWVMCTFFFTGTTAAWVTAKITLWFNIEKWSVSFWILKLCILLIGYQILLLFFGAIFGQFKFFWKYEKRILQAIGILKKAPPYRIIIFASGAGSNAANLIQYFNHNPKKARKGLVTKIITNNPSAGVVEIAKKENIPIDIITKAQFENGDNLNDWIKNAELIVLAGFLWKCPEKMVKALPQKIINIHPALLPKYGGKGMYGSHVHEAVLANGELESGITIHFIDEHYDCGETIFQAAVKIEKGETPQSLAEKIHHLEHEHYSRTVEKVIKKAKAKLNQ